MVSSSTSSQQVGKQTDDNGGEWMSVVKRGRVKAVKCNASKKCGPAMAQNGTSSASSKKVIKTENKNVTKTCTKASVYSTGVSLSLSMPGSTEKDNVSPVGEIQTFPQSSSVSSCANKHKKPKPSFLRIMSSSHHSKHIGNYSSVNILGSIQSKLTVAGISTKQSAASNFQVSCSKRSRADSRSRLFEEGTNVSSTDHIDWRSFGRPGRNVGLMSLPAEVISRGILSLLGPSDLAAFGAVSRQCHTMGTDKCLWEPLFRQDFPHFTMEPVCPSQWKTAYRIASLRLVESSRCFHTKKTFLECVLGVGLDFTINPKTHAVDYISVSQDLVSNNAMEKGGVKKDAFGNNLKVFLPLYFTKEHFQRGLPQIRKAVLSLTDGRRKKGDRPIATSFQPEMILDVFCKIINSFVVLLSDEGVSACEKSFQAFTRIHRLFLALAKEYPSIKKNASSRLKKFVGNEGNRLKGACPSLGLILPLLMIVDETDFSWANIRGHFVAETFDRCVLWICKKHPELEKTIDGNKPELPEKADARVRQSREAMTVALRLLMFHVYFLKAASQGTVQNRSGKYDRLFFQPTKSHADVEESKSDEQFKITTLSSESFRNHINAILHVQSWQKFFRFIGLYGPKSKEEMAKLLREHVRNSRRKKYHKAGMDFSRVQANGTSRLLSKGQQYSVSTALRQVTFTDTWSFRDGTKFLDATCIVYNGKKQIETIDFRHTSGQNMSIQHSGDVMTDNSGCHTIRINLDGLSKSVTALVFVISAYADARLSDIVNPRIAFSNADDPNAAPLCTYDLDAHDKVDELKSIIMCKLYRVKDGGGWHVLALGDSHRGDASNYGPIYKAAGQLV